MLSRIGINDFPRSVRLYSTLGGICAEDMVALNLEAEHKTVANLETRKPFLCDTPGGVLRASGMRSAPTEAERRLAIIQINVKIFIQYERTGEYLS